MAEQQKPPRHGGSVTLPKGASKEDVDNALRGSPPKAGKSENEEKS